MSVSIDDFGIDRLNVRERLDLIDLIWDSLPANLSAEELPAWHIAELQRRQVEAERNPCAGRAWRDVLEQLEGNL